MWGQRDIIYTCRYTVTTRMTSALTWAALLLFHNCEEQSHKTVSQITASEVKGEPKQIRTEVPLLTSLSRLTARPNRLSDLCFTHHSFSYRSREVHARVTRETRP